MVETHPLACWIVAVWVATVIVAVLADPVFAATANATVPFPLPLAPLVNVTHDASVLAVQAQPAAVVTVSDPVPPAVGTF